MIASVRGPLTAKTPTAALIQVGGITLRLQISVSCFETLPAVGKEVQLLTYLHVREDALQLFGFADETERGLFENLISVSGIGPRLATG
ncbi:MAG TPA: Holliday junction branch migration protein RuvA, partial [Candidatus Angelobacter sp.]|nr:Holliday junction branch migration protein RuvA [Candidatus Angelobacter sp.]